MSNIRSFVRRALPLGALLALVPLGAQAQGDAVSVRVTSADGAPVPGAFILIDSSTQPAAQPYGAGRYTISGVAAGTHTLTARRAEFHPATVSVTVSDTAVVADIVLRPVATALAAVTVIGSRSDLAETRARLQAVPGAVALIDRAAIASTRQANLNDVLRMTPGVYVRSRFGAADESQISVRGSGLRSHLHAHGVNLL